MPGIQFVNHSSFIFSHGSVRLICDPWMDGSVFDDGWDLLVPTRFAYEDFSQLTHIWFSHEHPDHFNPPNIKKIPKDIRAGLSVLYQTTIDQRIVKFCRGMGFGDVVEMKPGEWLALGDDVKVRCEPHDNGDSWLAIRTPDLSVLNLNDCVVTSVRECLDIVSKIGPVNVLATQFSYANRTGNPRDLPAMGKAAREKLDWVRTQVRAFEPAYVIPFASFSYFSHEDNWYLNEAVNRVGSAAELILSQTDAQAIVLYPGDHWNPRDDTPYDSESALDRYDEDYDRVRREGFRHRSRQVDLEQVIQHGNAFVELLRSRNSAFVSMALPTVSIFLLDLDLALTLSSRGLSAASREPDACDLVCKSDALDYCFLWDWGGRTLDINGRFYVPEGGQYWKFRIYAALSSFNSRGEGIRETVKTLQRRVLKRIGSNLASD